MSNNNTPFIISLVAVSIALFSFVSTNDVDKRKNVVDKIAVPANSEIVITSSLFDVITEFKKLSKEDQESYLTQITGASLFLEKYKHLGSSSDFNNILYGVVRDFGWEREKYPSFSDALEKYLKDSGYNIPRDLSNDEDRLWMYNIFNSIKLALESSYE